MLLRLSGECPWRSTVLSCLNGNPLSKGVRTVSSTTSRHLSNSPDETSSNSPSFFAKHFGPNAAQASPGFKKRYMMFIPAFSTHMCIGAPFGWSAISATLAKEHGYGRKNIWS